MRFDPWRKEDIMGLIYKEDIHYKKLSSIRWTVLILLFMLAANVLTDSYYYSMHYHIEIGAFVFLGSLLAILAILQAYDMIYLHSISYKYKLIDRELIFEKVVRGKSRAVLGVDVKHADLLVPANEEEDNRNIGRTYKFLCCSLKNSKVYCCIANRNGEKIRIYFEPSRELVAKLNMVLPGNDNGDDEMVS